MLVIFVFSSYFGKSIAIFLFLAQVNIYLYIFLLAELYVEFLKICVYNQPSLTSKG